MSGRKQSRRHSIMAAVAALLFASPAIAQSQLPAKFANDPVAQAVGPEVFNAALKEARVVWYGATSSDAFLSGGGIERFEKRFGIRLEQVQGRLRGLTDRLKTEGAVGRISADIFQANDQYLLEIYKAGLMAKWKPPAPELDKFDPNSFMRNPEGYWWPVQISAQALVVNTKMVKPDEIKSYWDLVDPKWQGKVVTRDPRSAGGGLNQFMGFMVEPTLGMDFIKKFAATKPSIIQGGTAATKDAVIRGQFAIGLNGRGEFMLDLPKGAPLAFVVPKEGQSWTPSSIGMLDKAPHPNAAKLLLTWFYEFPQLQLWTDVARGLPHPDVKESVPEMSIARYPLMTRIPEDVLEDSDGFVKQMETVFGIR
jgi:iron(III) transport system substrate-binding protein